MSKEVLFVEEPISFFPLPLGTIDITFGHSDNPKLIPKESLDYIPESEEIEIAIKFLYLDPTQFEHFCYPFVPREGVDRKEALQHLNEIALHYEIREEERVRIVSYLLRLWFQKPFKL